MKKKGLIMLTTLMLAGGAFASISAIKKGNVAQKATATSEGLYETKDFGSGEEEYRVIYYYVDANWEYGKDFGHTDKDFRYLFKTIDGESVVSSAYTVAFGNSGSGSYNEIISDFGAKIYLPTNVYSIEFRSRNDSGARYTTGEFGLTGDYSDRQAFVVTVDIYNHSSADPKGVWESKESFLSRFNTLYYTVTSPWNGGESSLNTDFVWIEHTGSDSETIGRDIPITDSMIHTFGNGNHYARLLVPSNSGTKVRFQNGHGKNWGAQCTQLGTITQDTSVFLYIDTENSYTTNQVWTQTPIIGADEYVFFSPSGKWAVADAAFKLTTTNIFGAGEYLEYMPDLTESLLGGKFTNERTCYYKLKEPCSTLEFKRWDPDYKDSKTEGYWNWYSNQCSIEYGKTWVHMGHNNDWESTWDTSGSNSDARMRTIEARIINSTTPTDETGRIFYNHTNSPWDGDGQGIVAVEVTGEEYANKYWNKTRYILSWFQDNDEYNPSDPYYGFADIPLDADDYKFVLLEKEGAGYTWNVQTNSAFTITDDSFAKVYYGSGSAKDDVAVSKGAAKDGYARTQLIMRVLAAIDTCSDNIYNGCGAYDELYGTFLHDDEHSRDIITGTAKAALVATRGGQEMSAQAHFEAMAYRSINGVPTSGTRINIFNGFISEEKGITVIILAAVSAVSLCALAFFYIKNRKEI